MSASGAGLVTLTTFEVELKAPDAATAERAAQLEAYALYCVCEDVDGTCLYRRQDFRVPISLIAR